MFNKKLMAVITLAMLLITSLGAPVSVQAAGDLNATGKLAAVEKIIYGVAQTGAILERVNRLEDDIHGAGSHDAILPRVDKLYEYVYKTTEIAPSLLTKLNAVEWTLTNSISTNTIKNRIENLETTINGSSAAGSLDERLDELMKLAYSAGEIEVVPAILAKDTLVKIKTLSTLNSKKSQVGDSVALGIAEDVYIGGVLILPKGASGTGKVVKVRPSRNFGRDAKLEISFDTVKAIDGSTVDVFVGDKAKEETKSLAMAAGASVAGMVILGPIGIIGGAFISGKDAEIPIGSQLYVQTQEDVEVYGIRVE